MSNGVRLKPPSSCKLSNYQVVSSVRYGPFNFEKDLRFIAEHCFHVYGINISTILQESKFAPTTIFHKDGVTIRLKGGSKALRMVKSSYYPGNFYSTFRMQLGNKVVCLAGSLSSGRMIACGTRQYFVLFLSLYYTHNLFM